MKTNIQKEIQEQISKDLTSNKRGACCQCANNCKACKNIKEAKAKTLSDFKPGEKGVVSKVMAIGAVKKHLLDMGITPNAEITFRKTAPFGDPIELTVRGYHLSIRKEEARTILMNAENPAKIS